MLRMGRVVEEGKKLVSWTVLAAEIHTSFWNFMIFFLGKIQEKQII